MTQTAPTQTLPRWGGLLTQFKCGPMRKSKQMIEFARALRRNATEAEKRLWQHLRGKRLGAKFRRQEPVGPYIADFLSYEIRLVIELDGGQHADTPSDRKRDAYLAHLGFKTLRFWNTQVFQDMDAVLSQIHAEIAARSKPSPLGEGLGGGPSE